MRTDLKIEIRAALAGSTSQKPVDTDALAQGRRRSRVEGALMELYQAQEVCCCKIIKGGCENVVWWEARDSSIARAQPLSVETMLQVRKIHSGVLSLAAPVYLIQRVEKKS